MNFYRKQGINMTFIPFSGYYTRDLANVYKHGDFYYAWKEEVKKTPKPKALGGNFGTKAHLAILDPNLIKEYMMKHEVYIKEPSLLGMMKDLCGEGLVVSEGALWKRKRKLIAKSFHYEFLKESIPQIYACVDELLEDLKNRELKNVNIMKEFQGITGDITGRIFFGETFAKSKIKGLTYSNFFAKLAENVGVMILDTSFQLFGRLPGKLGLVKLHAETIQQIRDLREFSFTLVDKMMKESKRKKDEGRHNERKHLIDIIYDQRLENPEDYLTEKEVVDEFIALYLGGMDTTGHLITMATYYLAKHPEYMDRLMQEIKTNIKSGSDITIDDLNKMEFMTAFLKESLRLATPSATSFERLAIKDHLLGKIKIKKGTIVLAANIVNMTDADFHDDPEKFDPMRWLDPNSRTLKSIGSNSFVFTPFHGGPRNCIGQNYAMVNAKMVLSLFLLKFNYELTNKNYQLRMTQRFMHEPEEELRYDLQIK